MIRAVEEANNNAVEHLLMGHPKDAVFTLIRALNAWKTQGGMVTKNQNLMQVDEGVAKQLYSVELGCELETTEPAFPFRWYGRPIAIASDSDSGEDSSIPEIALNRDLNAVVILYNLGIAYQLDASLQKQEGEYVLGRLGNTAALEAYTLALRALVACQEKLQRPYQYMSVCERLNFGLLHVAIVNNLLFLYAQSADLEGMTTCLTVLRKILSAVCSGLPDNNEEDFALFHCNAIIFPTPGSLSLSPAA